MIYKRVVERFLGERSVLHGANSREFPYYRLRLVLRRCSRCVALVGHSDAPREKNITNCVQFNFQGI